MDEYETPATDAVRQVGENLTGLAERVRATLAPLPELHYPAPWRVAETRGHVVVECADGHWVAECPTHAAAEAIVLAVNTFAGVSGQ